MSRRWALILIAANLVALAVLVFAYPQYMIAPGPVMPAHTAIADNCFACHAPFQAAAPARCVACHAVRDIGIRTTKGLSLPQRGLKQSFHQALRETDCMACHTDHSDPALTRRAAKSFSHTLLRFEVQSQCASCHKAPANAFHRDQTIGCSQCHSTTAWKPARFDHSRYFALDGDHNAPCATCHTTPNYRQYTCYGCHEHNPARIRAIHAEEGIRNLDNCVACHRNARGEGGEGGEGREGGRREGGGDD
jgi:hypothetical protein